MQITSFNKDINFSDDRITTTVILESSFSKEIRIVFKKGQKMKEHKTPYPIIIHVLSGEINLGIREIPHILKEGGIIALEGDVPHDLTANKDSFIRLTLLKSDSAQRVKDLTKE